jgi:hypothetical protein
MMRRIINYLKKKEMGCVFGENVEKNKETNRCKINKVVQDFRTFYRYFLKKL